MQEKAEEVARLFYSNGSVTINLLPILLFSFLGALREFQIYTVFCSPFSAFYLKNLLRHYTIINGSININKGSQPKLVCVRQLLSLNNVNINVIIGELYSSVFLPLLLPAYDALSGLYSSAAGYSANSVAYSSNYAPAAGYGYSARSSAVSVLIFCV